MTIIKVFAATAAPLHHWSNHMISLTLISYAHDDLQRLAEPLPTSQGGAGWARGMALFVAAAAITAGIVAALMGG